MTVQPTPLILRLDPAAAPVRTFGFSLAGRRFLTDTPLSFLGGQEAGGPWPEAAWELGDDGSEATASIPGFLGSGLVAGSQRQIECRFAGTRGWLEIEGVGSFTLSPRGLAWRRRATEDLSLLEQAVLGPLLLLLLAFHDVFVLHASGAERQGRAHLFLGDSGAGKSTLAAALMEHGWSRIADDLVALELRGDDLLAHADFPQLKLSPPPRSSTAPAPAAVAAIHLLAEAPAMEHEVLSRSQAVLALLRHTAAARLFPPSLLGRHLETMTRWARCTAVCRLAYPRRFEALPAVGAALSQPAAGGSHPVAGG